MDKNFPIAFVAFSWLAIAGCTIGDTPEVTNPTPTPAPVTESTPAVEEPFNTPVVTGEPTTTSAANLIQSTSATERSRIISQGRDDPFAGIVQQIPRPIAETPTERTLVSPQGVLRIPPLPTLTEPREPLRPSTAPTARTAPTTATTARASTPQTTASTRSATQNPSIRPDIMAGILPDLTLGSELPPPPQPELAEGVMVTGVVLIGQKAQAIIKVPDEQTSRYVQAGQRLGNGLLIKRIEMNEGSNPIVIIEQYGIEVARMVGEQPIDSASSANNLGAS
ncbi:hypothetical protein [Nodularia chucula]|uniref:hypothetical protein n=1 Tax=Nodularia chucula TaxID=3093667 RepID=UPI0039C5FF0A